MGEAGMLAGLVARLIGASRGETPALFNDACIYLQALERGWTVTTRNIHHYDLVDQLLPAGRCCSTSGPERDARVLFAYPRGAPTTTL
jgi:hypothetical protein